jgi:hypothetical protein
VPQPDDENEEDPVMNGVNNPVVADSDAVQIFAAGERLNSLRSRVTAQRIGAEHDPSLDVVRELSQLPSC